MTDKVITAEQSSNGAEQTLYTCANVNGACVKTVYISNVSGGSVTAKVTRNDLTICADAPVGAGDAIIVEDIWMENTDVLKWNGGAIGDSDAVLSGVEFE